MNGQIDVDQRAIVGCLLGTALGDALGLPYEGLSPRRARLLLGQPDRFRMLLRGGLVSDDTEHTCMVLQAWLAAEGDLHLFERDFARRLRWWLLSLPAGTGRATARAILKLWIGLSPDRSGVHSAGNGPAMRAAVLGLVAETEDQLQRLVAASSRITHTDPRALQGALVVAWTARYFREHSTINSTEFFEWLAERLGKTEASELRQCLDDVSNSLGRAESTLDFSARQYHGKGPSGYVLHTVPLVLHACLNQPDDYLRAIQKTVRCGGDADTTAAIVGGIIGGRVGKDGLPMELLNSYIDWPRSVNWIARLADATTARRAGNQAVKTPELFWPLLLTRNLLFLIVVLLHGFRRLLPPF